MIPLLAAVLLAGAAGAGPVLVSDACGADTTTTESGSRCRVDKIDKRMKQQRVPAELKVRSVATRTASDEWKPFFAGRLHAQF